jgi:hypothetical protein
VCGGGLSFKVVEWWSGGVAVVVIVVFAQFYLAV